MLRNRPPPMKSAAVTAPSPLTTKPVDVVNEDAKMRPVSSFLSTALTACAATASIGVVTSVAEAQTYRNDSPSYQSREYAALGLVDSIETVSGTNKGNRIAGAILGGVIGGVLGHQIGSGRGNDAATVVGALGGAAVGHEIGESKGTLDSYRVSVRMDDGGVRIVEQSSLNGLRIGDRVRIDGDRVALYAGGRDRNDAQGAQGYIAPPPSAAYASPPADLYQDQRSQAPQDERILFDRDGNRISYPNEERNPPDSPYRKVGEARYDAEGFRLDADGFRVDAQGYRIDTQGYRIDAQGYRIDAQGYRVDAQGYRLDDRGNRL